MQRQINTVEARAKLPARRAPFWMKLQRGLGLGFRKLTPSSPGTWLARLYDATTGKDAWRSLGTFEHLPAAQRFTAAKMAAEELHRHVEGGGAADTLTVSEACTAYVAHLRADGRHAAADDAEGRFRRWIAGSQIANVDLRKLQQRHVRAWRRELAGADVIVNPHAEKEERRTRSRTAASLNRDMSALRAALNLARDGGAVASDAAWRAALKPEARATRSRGLYLDRQQRAALVAHAPADLAAFLRSLCLLPLRPGAMAALTVADFDRKLSTLTVRTDKAGAGRALRLPEATAAFFAEQCANKLPAARIFTRADGAPWGKDSWKKLVKAAAAAAGLPATTTAYVLRHSVITDLMAAGLDVLTVARLSGTSLQMIEQHYGHLRGDAAAAALATLGG